MNKDELKDLNLSDEQYKAIDEFLQEESLTLEDINDISEDEDGLRIDAGAEYLLMTDEQADEKAEEYIKSSLWAFNSDFIIGHSKVLDYDKGSEDILKAIQEQCESGNDAVLRLIDDIDEFIEDAISSDGRGHFLSSYDGNEYELQKGDFVYIREN